MHKLYRNSVITLLFFIIVVATFQSLAIIIASYILVPALFLMVVLSDTSNLFRYQHLNILIILLLPIIFSGNQAIDYSLFWKEVGLYLLVLFYCISIFIISLRSPEIITYIYVFYILKFIIIIFYAYKNGLFLVDISSDRFGLEELNSNVFGYFGFFALVSSVLLYQFLERKYLRYLFVLLSIALIFISVFSASRGTIFISLLTFFLLGVWSDFLSIRNKFANYFIITALIFIIISPYLFKYYESSLLRSRFDELEEDSRKDLLISAFSLGKDHLFTGVGSGNFKLLNQYHQFSHSSFAEIFVNNGIFALILFILFIGEFLLRIYQLKRVQQSKMLHRKFLAFWLVFLVYNFLYVFYLNHFLLGFFCLVRAHLEVEYFNAKIDFKLVNKMQ